MTITISINGTPVSNEIHFTSMSPWFGQPKTVKHVIDGANYDQIIHTGKNSKSTTIKGYCKRNAANLTELDTLVSGELITVTHSVEGTHNGIVTALQPTESGGGLFVSFSMTVVEQ